MTRTALIVGAGIGGLSAAISLRKVGWNVHVFERAASVRELGFALLADDNAPIVNAVNDQPATGHGHGGDRVANVSGHAALEVEFRVLEAPEQVPELVR